MTRKRALRDEHRIKCEKVKPTRRIERRSASYELSDTQSPHRHSNSADLVEESPQMGSAWSCIECDGCEGWRLQLRLHLLN